MTFEDINVLGNIIDTTWGKSSTAHKGPVFSSCKVSFLGKSLNEDDGEYTDGDVQLLVSHVCVLNFGSVGEREKEMKKASGEADGVLDACLKKIKEDFKDETGRTLKVKQVGEPNESWELLSLGQFSGRRDCYFRKQIIVEVK